MFTGIIQDVGVLESIQRTAKTARVQIYSPVISQEAQLGDSICTNGVCLTVSQKSDRHFWADLSGETLSRSTFANMQPKTELNLEQSLRPMDRMGGHIVGGHVDAIGTIASLEELGEFWNLEVLFPESVARFIAEKGSLSIDGISLTVTHVDDEKAGFAIVPFTIHHTNLRSLKPGDAVNLEVDMLARYVDRLLSFSDQPSEKGLSQQKLKEFGFL